MLDADEMAGQRPIFVDAFPDAAGENAFVVMSFAPFFPSSWNRTDSHWAPWIKAAWNCAWRDVSQEARRASRGPSSATSGAVALAVEPQTSRLERTTMSAEVQSDTVSGIHHSLVMRCPLPREFSADPRTKWELDLQVTGSPDGPAVQRELRYERAGVPVARESFLRPGTGPALCTMVIKPFAALLRPWVQFHLATGFDQILVYIEENETFWADEALYGLPGRSKVTLVPFYFGSISDRRHFNLQSSMEHHCLYQARGRVEWLAHADVDEYFDLKLQESGKNPNIGQYLAVLPPNTGALLPQIQFWMSERTEGERAAGREEEALPFPCYLTCKPDGYLRSFRSKWIVRPHLVDRILNPHEVTVVANASVHVADPERELRVNHFKHCSPDLPKSKCFRTVPKGRFRFFQDPPCERDGSFLSQCLAVMRA